MNLYSSQRFKVNLFPLISIKGFLFPNLSFKILLSFIISLRLLILILSNSYILDFNLEHISIGLGLYFSSIITLCFSSQLDLLVFIY
ncbi:hypothetical protein AMV056 [Betaentomopoxvirus amoorei]|uniref:AMV056 n=1 Tax=Amsacta moorei entomopoxvirus TaxID=28321 RepID=Q9EMZ2_AMEPV|nr:hypothetical protein AMV056 [Amsacta moorei entomopoxvirus]AAG02762.1 AMV056 [Amsacta moorei entomopoxvirus]